jgi:hypothetical protein
MLDTEGMVTRQHQYKMGTMDGDKLLHRIRDGDRCNLPIIRSSRVSQSNLCLMFLKLNSFKDITLMHMYQIAKCL